MSILSTQLEQDLLDLPVGERVELAEKLLASVARDESREDLSTWELEIRKRLQDVRECRVECRDARKAVLEIMSELA